MARGGDCGVAVAEFVDEPLGVFAGGGVDFDVDVGHGSVVFVGEFDVGVGDHGEVGDAAVEHGGLAVVLGEAFLVVLVRPPDEGCDLSDDFFFGDFGDSADAVRGGGLHGDGVDEVLVAGDDAGALGSLDALAAAVADDVGADVDEAVEVFARREAVRGVDDDACAVCVCDVDDVFECDVFRRCVSDPVDHLGVGVVDECLVVLLGGDDFCGTAIWVRFADFDELDAGGFDGHGVAVIDVFVAFVVLGSCEAFGDAWDLAALDVWQLLNQGLVGAGDDCGGGDHEAGGATGDDVAVIGVGDFRDDFAGGFLELFEVDEVVGGGAHRLEGRIGDEGAAHDGVMAGCVDEFPDA